MQSASKSPLSSELTEFAAQASSPHTQRAYASDWNHFKAWCKNRGRSALPAPADDVALYFRFCAEKLHLKVSTIQRRCAAIAETHNQNRHPSPTDAWIVRNTLKRLRYDHGSLPNEKKPMSLENIKAMLQHCSDSMSGIRDKALLLTGFCGALRRSDLVNLDIEDLAKADEGLVLTIRDPQRKAPRKLGLPYGKDPHSCPVQALFAWIEKAQITDGPLFRAVTKFNRPRATRMSDRVVADIVKKYSALIGKRAALFSAHSLRSGFAIAAAQAGASDRSIQNQTGHATLQSLRRYTRAAEIFRDNAVKKLNI
jgi:site-specific recombinase XerD